MWHCHNMPIDATRKDVERFLIWLNASPSSFFAPDTPLFIGRAPGRLDLMGGIADYSGSLVLELPLAVATLVAVQRRAEPVITVSSTAINEIVGAATVTVPLHSFSTNNQLISYADAHKLLGSNSDTAWAAYVIGVLFVLQKEKALLPQSGLRIQIHCEVPIGKGVSSSAALEVATMQAISAAYQLDIDGRDTAFLCQKVENLVVGAPCGIMDQMTSACGEQDSLLALLCQPAELIGTVPLPENIEIWGIDSGVRHAVSGADYASVRVGAFMGYRIIADLMDFSVSHHDGDTLNIIDPYWQGYLANIPPSLWETRYRDQIPLQMGGANFLQRYAGSTDHVTTIDPQRVYPVRQSTAHPIYEHHRVQLFRSLLAYSTTTESDLILLGELMYQSHASYSGCGLGSRGTDRLVELIRASGPEAGLYGAKITGGGSGGTVAVLARKGSQHIIHQIITAYEQETGLPTALLQGSSPGAKSWGTLTSIYRTNTLL